MGRCGEREAGDQHLALDVESAQGQHQTGRAAVDGHDVATGHGLRDEGFEFGDRLAVGQFARIPDLAQARQQRIEIGQRGRSNRQALHVCIGSRVPLRLRHVPTSWSLPAPCAVMSGCLAAARTASARALHAWRRRNATRMPGIAGLTDRDARAWVGTRRIASRCGVGGSMRARGIATAGVRECDGSDPAWSCDNPIPVSGARAAVSFRNRADPVVAWKVR